MPHLDRSMMKTGIQRGCRTSWVLIRVILPTYVVVDLLKSTPVIPALGRAFGPMMHPLGLPGEAAMALAPSVSRSAPFGGTRECVGVPRVTPGPEP